MAGVSEMMPVLLGAIGIWGLPLGLILSLLVDTMLGLHVMVIGLILVLAGHTPFWREAIREGGTRGLGAVFVTFVDLFLPLPAAVLALFRSVVAGKR